MAYADQSMSGSKVTALVIVALIHIALGYALVTGLAYEGARQILKKVTTVDIKEEEKKPEEPPPPPPKDIAPPPIVAPPVKIDVNPVAPPVVTVPVAPPPVALVPVIVPPAAPPPPAPSQARGARPKNQSSWAARIQEAYPSDALRMEKEGRVGVRVTIGPDGRVSGCTVTSSSGTPSLDRAACDGMQRYGRYDPALDDGGNPTSGSASTAIVYRLN